MKNILVNIILILLLVLSGIGLYKLYADKKQLEETLQTQINLTQQIEQEYNQAKIALTNKDIKVNILDKKLKEALKRKTITKTIYVKVKDEVTGEGTASTDVTNTSIFKFVDYRLEATLNTNTRQFKYKLSQMFDINIYQAGPYDYRIEMIEKNRITGEFVRLVGIRDFSVVQKVEEALAWNYGFNLNVGFAGYVGPDYKIRPEPYVLFNFISYGKTHLDSQWRFLSLGIGLENAFVAPVQYNLGGLIGFLSDAWIDLFIGTSWKGKLIGGIGISSTF